MAAYIVSQESTGTDLATVYNLDKAQRIAEAWSAAPDAGTLTVSRLYESGPRKGQRVPISFHPDESEPLAPTGNLNTDIPW